jgi:nitroreductase
LRQSSDLPTRELRRYGVAPIRLAAGASAVKLGNTDKAEEEWWMDVIDAIHSRRSIRSYQSNPVDRDLIESVIWDAAQAPPPFSGQVPWTFNVIEGVERIAALGARAMDHARATRPNSASRLWLDRPGFQIFWNAPVLILISGELEDCCRAAQNLMLSAHARGLGTCWVGSPLLWLRTEEVKAELQVPAVLTPNVAMCLGYANAVPPTSERERPQVIWVS